MRFISIPIIQSTGSNAGAAGQVGTILPHKKWINASVVCPKNGTVNVVIIYSGNNPNPAIRVAMGIVKGRDTFKEEWDHLDLKESLAISEPDTYLRRAVLTNISVTEGELLGVRVQNMEPDYNLNIAAIYMKYH